MWPDHFEAEGRWFCQHGFWVFPASLAQQVCALPDKYDSQPDWALQEVAADSAEQAVEVAREFMALAKQASIAFCWPLDGYNIEKAEWKKHAWKHIRFEDLVEVGKNARFHVVAYLRMEPNEARELLQRAAKRDPVAVARVRHLYRQGELREVAELVCARAQLADEIPTVDELAGEYADTIHSNRDADAAQAARKNLDVLLAKKSALGPGAGAGRPKESYHRESVLLAFLIDLTGVFCTSGNEREFHSGGPLVCRSRGTSPNRS